MKIIEWTEEQAEGWKVWVAARPECIQVLCERLPPDRLYLMKTTRQRVYIVAYNEGGTVTVGITGQYNAVAFDRQVFGISPDDLEECDLPGPDENLGAIFTEQKDIDAFIELTKEVILKKNLAEKIMSEK